MIHHYLMRDGAGRPKITCGLHRSDDISTVATKITCKKCLEVLIPKHEQVLDVMKKNYGTEATLEVSDPQAESKSSS